MDLKLDDSLKALIDLGKRSGYLTYDQVNAQIPPTPSSRRGSTRSSSCSRSTASSSSTRRGRGPGRPRRRPSRRGRPAARGRTSPSPTTATASASTTRSACTSRRWARSRCSTREQEIALAKKIEVTRKRFRRKVLECDYALRNVVETLKRVHTRRAAVRPHDQGVADREPGEGQDPPADAAQPARRSSTLMEQNVEDFDRAARRAHVRGRARRDLRRGLKIRRRKAVTLVEELSIRTQKVQPLMKKLEQISRADGRAGAADRGAAGPARRPRRTGPTSRRSCTT